MFSVMLIYIIIASVFFGVHLKGKRELLLNKNFVKISIIQLAVFAWGPYLLVEYWKATGFELYVLMFVSATSLAIAIASLVMGVTYEFLADDEVPTHEEPEEPPPKEVESNAQERIEEILRKNRRD